MQTDGLWKREYGNADVEFIIEDLIFFPWTKPEFWSLLYFTAITEEVKMPMVYFERMQHTGAVVQ